MLDVKPIFHANRGKKAFSCYHEEIFADKLTKIVGKFKKRRADGHIFCS